MALPAVVRTWQYAVNQSFPALGSATADARALLRAIKNQLIGAGGATWTDSAGNTITPTGAWSVVGSSNSSAAGMDAVDRWAADSNLVNAAGASAHSWIVLQQTGLSATFQLLIDLNGGAPESISVKVSHTAFTGGSTTAAPTSANSVSLITTTSWGGSVGDFASRLHVMRSADGASTRVLIARNNQLVALWMFGTASNPDPGWAQPYLAFLVGSSANAPSSATPSATSLTGTANIGTFGTSGFFMFFSSEGIGAGPAYQQLTGASSFSGALPMFPIRVLSTTGGQAGPLGTVVDLWLGLANNPTPTTYPDTGTLKQFVQAGPLIFSWNRSTPLFS